MIIRLLKLLAIASVIALTACSSGKYDAAKANALASKVESGYEIKSSDYAEMITQCEGAAELIEAKFDEILKYKQEGNNEKLQQAFEEMTNDDVMNAADNFQTLGEFLRTAPLDEQNAKRWQEFQPKAEALAMKMFQIFQ